MTYTQAQAEFAQALGVLLSSAALVHGGKFRLRLDWGYRDKKANESVGGHARSLHMDRMAQDVTVYVVAPGGDVSAASAGDTAMVLETLHNIWDQLGGSKRITGDMGHFSWAWGDVR